MTPLTPSRRIVILGASNVAFAFPMIATACLNSSAGPVQLFAAHGHGRSFCSRNVVLNRGLPSLNECGIWEALESQPDTVEKWALVTDAGNDLIYGRSVERVASKIQLALQRLDDLGFPITFVRPPIERIMQLTDFQYRVIKKILFPGQTVPWAIISQRVLELDQILCEDVTGRGGRLVTPRVNRYGIDPIHIRGSAKPRAWTEILSAWPFPETPDVYWNGWRNATKIWKLPPAERSFWSRTYFNEQPTLQTTNQSTLWQF